MHYGGNASFLDETTERREYPLATAVFAAIDSVSDHNPAEFINITKPSWSSENAVVHRLIIRGLALAVRSEPSIGLEYLGGDPRRLALGNYQSEEQSDSIELIRQTAPLLSQPDLKRLEDLILGWSKYRDRTNLTDDQKMWEREVRLRLLDAIPPDIRSIKLTAIIEREKATLPDWNSSSDRSARRYSRSGFVRRIPPLSKEKMIDAENEEILTAIENCPSDGHHRDTWVEVEGGWEEPGGPMDIASEIVEMAKEQPKRASELIKFLASKGKEDVAASAMHRLSEIALSDTDILDFARAIVAIKPKSEELRSALSFILYRQAFKSGGLPDDLCDALRQWLAMPWDSKFANFKEYKSSGSKEESPILWARGWGLIDTDRSFNSLIAITEGYLRRQPPETKKWLDVIEEHLQRDISIHTWAAYGRELQWIRFAECDQTRGIAIVLQLFNRFPELIHQTEGVALIARISDLFSREFLTSILDSLRASNQDWSKQAFGELLTLIAIRNDEHKWAIDLLNTELSKVGAIATEEPIALGIAFAAANLWDEADLRLKSAQVLCKLIPKTTARLGKAIQTVFWTQDNFAVEEPTISLLRTLGENPLSLKFIGIVDLVAHLVGLVIHERRLVLSVCEAIVKSGRQEAELFEAGPNLVKIAMTLQRFNDTRSAGLALFEQFLRLGLDDAFTVLHDIDIRPTAVALPMPRQRRRRTRARRR